MPKKVDKKEGRKEGRAIFVLWVVLLLLSVGVLALHGCSGKSQTTTPDNENQLVPVKPDLGMFRNLEWTNPPVGDELIPRQPPAPAGESNADITNVIYDHFYPVGYPGRIKDHWHGGPLYPQEDAYTYTIAAWQRPEGEISNIYFRVLYRDGDGVYGMSPEIMVQNINGWIHEWPAVTAHLRYDGRIVVDIAFQARVNENQRWIIMHARSIQGTPQVFSSFPPAVVDSPISMPYYDCQHPDIVIDAAPDTILYPSCNRLHLVFEVNAGWGSTSRIDYRKALDWGDHLQWVEQGPLSTNSPSPYCERPRIDVGYDDSQVIQVLFQSPTVYYVGVVWNTMHFTGGLKADVEYCGFWAQFFFPNPPLVYQLKTAGTLDFHVYPYIEIDPVELGGGLNPRFTHVVWTETVLNPGTGQFENAVMWGQYTGRIIPYGIPSAQLLYAGAIPGGRNGLPTYATFTREVDEGGLLRRKGWLTWVHDDGPNDPNVEVWAGALEYNKADPWMYYPVNQEQIGGGDSSIYEPYVYGPDVATFNQVLCRSIWTDFDDGTFYSIFGDSSEY